MLSSSWLIRERRKEGREKGVCGLLLLEFKTSLWKGAMGSSQCPFSLFQLQAGCWNTLKSPARQSCIWRGNYSWCHSINLFPYSRGIIWALLLDTDPSWEQGGGRKKLVDIEFFQLKECLDSSSAGQFQAGCWSWIFPGSVCSAVSLFAMQIKSVNIHVILRLHKWECQHLETLIDFSPPPWRRYVVCGIWERLSGTCLGRCVRSSWNSGSC